MVDVPGSGRNESSQESKKYETWNPITLRGVVMKAEPRQGH